MHIALRQEREERRDETLRVGLWMFLATVAMLFAALASAYIVRRSGSDWTRIALPNVLWMNTLVLCASSAALEIGAWSGSRRRWTAALWGFAGALTLGVAFLVGQVQAWNDLRAAGVYLPSSPHSSFVYLLTGAHAVHVGAALAVLGYTCVVAAGPGRVDARRWSRVTGQARAFWHFLLGVWWAVLLLLVAY